MIATWQFFYSAVKEFPAISQPSGQRAAQFSDFSSYWSMYAWKLCALCCSGTGPKSDSDRFPLRRIWASTDWAKWTQSHNHREIICYLEVTSAKFRTPSCLRSSAAPQQLCKSHITWSSAVTTPRSCINAVGKLILSANAGKCRVEVLSKHQPTAWETIQHKVLYHAWVLFQQSFRINSLIKTCASIFLSGLWRKQDKFHHSLTHRFTPSASHWTIFFQIRCSFGASCSDRFLFAFGKHKHRTFWR